MALQLKNKSFTPTQASASQTAFTASGNTVLNGVFLHENSHGGLASIYLFNAADSTVTTLIEFTTVASGSQLLTSPIGMQAGDEIRVNVNRTGPTFLFSFAISTSSTPALALDGLSDVNAGTPNTSDVLQWNGSSWVAAAGGTSTGGTTFAALTDSNISGVQTGQFIKWDGTDWINFTVGSDDIAEGSSNKYYTETAFGNSFNGKTTIDLQEAGTSLFYSDARVASSAAVVANSAKTSYTDAAQVSTNTTKLAGIDAGATANQTDAYLLNRVYHTGTQLAATVSDLSSAVDTRIGVAKIEDLDEVSSTAPSVGQVLKWSGSEWAPAADNSSTSTGGGIVDSVNGISQSSVVLDTDDISEGTNKYTTAAEITKLAGIATGATANQTDAYLLDRSYHTGTQLSGTISDFTAETESVIDDVLGSTSDLTEGSNLYYTDARADARIALIDADDIDDASTAHKFVAAGDVTKLGHISVTSAVNLNTINTMATLALTTANTASSAVTTHANQLRNHGDVDYTEANPANIPVGSLFCWQGTEWKDKEVDLQDLANVSTPTTGEFLKWDGTNWVTAAVTATAGATIQDADTALSAAGNYEAGSRLMKLVNTNTTLVSGKIFRLSGSGWDATTNATEAGSTGLMAMCSSDSTTGSAMITEGIARTRLSISGASIGDPVFLSTNNEVTLTAPTSAATVLQLGTVVDPTNNMIYFNPDKTTIRIQ